ncbi:hypothetical protein V1477_018940 [Vespula maculifrons]|uniref:Uncharacterized protein n=1 Tax=Vespula maculifrons TaxID=7453 RepID=A0ABD2ASW6_VESMC
MTRNLPIKTNSFHCEYTKLRGCVAKTKIPASLNLIAERGKGKSNREEVRSGEEKREEKRGSLSAVAALTKSTKADGEGSVAHGLDPWDWIHETGSAQRFRPAGMPKQEKDKEEEETKKRRGGGEEMVEEAGG